VFDLRLKAVGCAFAFAPDAIAHFRPRKTLRAFYKQYYLYARGDGKANLWRKRHAIRYATYLIALPLILALTLFAHPAFALAGLAGGAIYTRAPYRRLSANLRWARANGARSTPLSVAYAAALIPVLRAVGDIAKLIGYPVGVRWRRAQRPPDWRLVSSQ